MMSFLVWCFVIFTLAEVHLIYFSTISWCVRILNDSGIRLSARIILSETSHRYFLV